MTNERLMIFHFFFTVRVHLRLQGIWRHWWGFLCTLFFDPNLHVLDPVRPGFHAAARKNEFELLHVYRRRPWQRLLPIQKGPHCNSSIFQASWLDKWSIPSTFLLLYFQFPINAILPVITALTYFGFSAKISYHRRLLAPAIGKSQRL